MGHFLLPSQVGTFGHVSSTEVHCIPWAVCVTTAGIFFLVEDYVLGAILAGACTSCALENASDLIKPLWRWKTEIT